MKKAVFKTNLESIPLLKQGKVRDMYDLGDRLLMVATDRISAFDVIMPDPVPDKGVVLNRISLYWMDMMSAIVKNHVVTGEVAEFPAQLQPFAEQLEGRSTLVAKTEPLPVECVVRGYISGSGWKSYLESGSVCGVNLPKGLKESDKLPEPIFTPSTKEEAGKHDVNIDFEEMSRRIGRERSEQVRSLSLEIYRKGAEAAFEKGIIIADTKFEFGILNDEIYLIDEILTPDSSRFWPVDRYAPGGPQESFDKQYLRDYLESVQWNKKAPAPNLPDEIIENTRRKYLDAYKVLTGRDLE